MAIRLNDEVKVSISVGDEDITAVFPGYNTQEMLKATKTLLSSRFVVGRGGRNPQDKTFEARTRFFDEMCLRVENIEVPDGTGGFVPLTSERAAWQAEVPPNWKVSFVIPFEEKSTLSEEDRGN